MFFSPFTWNSSGLIVTYPCSYGVCSSIILYFPIGSFSMCFAIPVVVHFSISSPFAFSSFSTAPSTCSFVSMSTKFISIFVIPLCTSMVLFWLTSAVVCICPCSFIVNVVSSDFAYPSTGVVSIILYCSFVFSPFMFFACSSVFQFSIMFPVLSCICSVEPICVCLFWSIFLMFIWVFGFVISFSISFVSICNGSYSPFISNVLLFFTWFSCASISFR